MIHFLLETATAAGTIWAVWTAIQALHETRKSSEYERTPYLRLQWKNIVNGGVYKRIEISNKGRGLARHIKVKPIVFEGGDTKTAISFKEIAVISAGESAWLETSIDSNQALIPLLQEAYDRSDEKIIDDNGDLMDLSYKFDFVDIVGAPYKASFEQSLDEAGGFHEKYQHKKCNLCK